MCIRDRCESIELVALLSEEWTTSQEDIDQMNEQSARVGDFTEELLPHLDSAYNLARWLTRDDTDAEDIVQEAYLRAFRHFGRFRGVNARAWLLTIVRNTSYRWLRKNRLQQADTEFDEAIHIGHTVTDPETLVLQLSLIHI